FSTRPVVSTNFILPVKNGWQAEQISTVMFLRVLRVTNLLPQPHVTVASTYSGCIPVFIRVLRSCLHGRRKLHFKEWTACRKEGHWPRLPLRRGSTRNSTQKTTPKQTKHLRRTNQPAEVFHQ